MKPSALSTVIFGLSRNFEELRQFLKSTSFSRAILVGIAVTLPIVLGLQFGCFEVGLALGFGAFWCSPGDITGSFQHKRVGILISAAMVTVVSFIGGYLHYETWLSLPVLGILSFSIAFISVYGFRASLISFSGLLALVLSFAHDAEELEIYQHALLIGAGGLWYLLLADIWNRINPKAETEELFSETFVLTAEFLETRGNLIAPYKARDDLQSELLKLQSEITEKHTTLREILILSGQTAGWSHYRDKRLLVFVQLVEMMETAIANPVNYDRMDELFTEHPQYIKLFQDLIFKMSDQLRMISEAGNDKNKMPGNELVRRCFEKASKEVASLRKTLDYEQFLMLQNFLEYQEKQFKKLKRIKWLLGDPNTSDVEFIDRKAAKRFLEPQDYDPRLLLENFSFKSVIFKHSLRLAITVMIGYVLGLIFPFQNPYWILLTIIVIMRPNYGLTKSRAKDRSIGTLIGGGVAAGIVFLIQNPYAYGAMGLLSLVIAFSLIQTRSRASAAFITLSVVFVFAILEPDVLSVIKFRILDTLVGAGLSYAAMRWLFPAWEFVEMNESIEKSVKANKDFLHKIAEYYQRKGNVPNSYKIARKNAFLETSNLNSAFQRMRQEPRSKQNEMDKNYELVVLNHNFLAALASLSTYIQYHRTTEASERFKLGTEKIAKNMELVIECLKENKCEISGETSETDPLFKADLPSFDSVNTRDLKFEEEKSIRNMQEAHLIWEQLQWLFSISSKMLTLTASVEKK